MLHYVSTRRWSFVGLAVLIVGAAGCAVAVQYAIKMLVDAMVAPSEMNVVWTALGLFVGLIAVESALWRLTGWLGCRTTVGVGVSVRVDLLDHLSGQPMRYFAENLPGSLGQRITATAGNFGALINTVAWRIMPPVVDFAGATIIFATVDWRMTVALGLYVGAITAGLIVYGERGRLHHRTYADQAGVAAGGLVDVISNMWSVKAFTARRRERDRLATTFKEEAAAQRRSWMYTERARLLHDIALWLMAGTMLFWAVSLWSSGRITPGEVVLVSTLTFRILHGSRELALALVDVSQQVGFVEETLRVIAQPQTVIDVPNAPALARRNATIEFKDVSFAYGSGRDAVHGIDFEIAPGQKVGIVGPSGAGKSTLIHLLQRLHDVTVGDIRIGGQSISAVSQDSLRAMLAVVPQEISLFHRSVRDNIRFGNPDATDAALLAASRAANCDGFIQRLPDGYDTIVGDRGTRLSGGQRQRVGIARALVKDAPILILDEATSALDTDSEMEIQRALVTGYADRTIIAVAHRLSTLAAFDRVIVMVDGQIAEDGRPADLVRAGGIFARMWRRQAGDFALGERADTKAA